MKTYPLLLLFLALAASPATALQESNGTPRFTLQMADRSLLFSPTDVVIVVDYPAGGGNGLHRDQGKLAFLGANPEVLISGKVLKSGAGNAGKIVYHDLWPQIDLIVTSDGKRVQFQFVGRTGADLGRISLGHLCQRGLMDASGRLAGSLFPTPIPVPLPVAWQKIHGEASPVAANAVVDEDGNGRSIIRFELGAFDLSRKLVLRPNLRCLCGCLDHLATLDRGNLVVKRPRNGFHSGRQAAAASQVSEAFSQGTTGRNGLSKARAKTKATQVDLPKPPPFKLETKGRDGISRRKGKTHTQRPGDILRPFH